MDEGDGLEEFIIEGVRHIVVVDLIVPDVGGMGPGGDCQWQSGLEITSQNSSIGRVHTMLW